MPILLVVFLVACLLLIAGLMLRAYLIRQKAIFESALGMLVYADDGMKIDSKLFNAIEAMFVEGMQPLFPDDDLATHLGAMSCHFVDEKIQGKYNGMTNYEYGITVHQQVKDLYRTALAYELLNACLWRFRGYNVAIDEGGDSRKVYDVRLREVFAIRPWMSRLLRRIL